MRTADAIRLLESIRFEVRRYPVKAAHEALYSLEKWVREGGGLEDVHGVDPRIDREKHAGRDVPDDRDAEGTGGSDAPGARPAAGEAGDGVVSDADLARSLRRINRWGKGEGGL